MSNITPAQQTTLEAAVKRPNGSIHPLPDNIKGGAAKKVIKALHQQGLIEECQRSRELTHLCSRELTRAVRGSRIYDGGVKREKRLGVCSG